MAERSRGFATPAEQWHDAERDLAAAEASGDQQAIGAANQRIDGLVATWRDQAAADEREARSQAAQAARFSSDVRRPLVRPKSGSEALAEALLVATGRARARSGRWFE